jgi:hypothetical protein
MPSAKQGPLPRDTPSSIRLWPWPAKRLSHRDTGRQRLFTLASPSAREGGAPVHAPVASGNRASLSPDVACRLSATLYDARAHPRAFDPRARAGLVAPPLTGTDRYRLRCPSVASPPWKDRKPQLARAGAYARRAPLAWKEQVASQSRRGKASAPFVTNDLARTLLGELWVPESPFRTSARSGRPRVTSPRPRSAAWISLREKRKRREDRGTFCHDETLTRPEDCSSVRARIAAPSRRLRRGIAQRHTRLCVRFGGPPASDETSG